MHKPSMTGLWLAGVYRDSCLSAICSKGLQFQRGEAGNCLYPLLQLVPWLIAMIATKLFTRSIISVEEA